MAIRRDAELTSRGTGLRLGSRDRLCNLRVMVGEKPHNRLQSLRKGPKDICLKTFGHVEAKFPQGVEPFSYEVKLSVRR